MFDELEFEVDIKGCDFKKARSPLNWWTGFFWAVEFKNSEPKQGSLVMMASQRPCS